MATSLEKLENKVQIHHLHIERFRMVKRFLKSVQYIRIYSTKCVSFLAVSYRTFTNKLCQLWSYCTEFHEIFTQYRCIVYTVNAHIAVAISHTSAPREKVRYDTKLVAMATFLEESEKLNRIEKIQANTFHLVKKS